MVMQMCQLQESGFDFGASLDLNKAFDSVHAKLAVEALRLHGLPPKLRRCIQDAWISQVRWPVVAGSVDPRTIDACQVLPQKDPWSPWAMSLLTGLLASEVQFRLPFAFHQFLYIDDRNVLRRLLQDVVRVIFEWNGVASPFGLTNNDSKLQVWTVSDPLPCVDAFPSAFTGRPRVLGHVLPTSGLPGQQVHDPAIETCWSTVERCCRRIALLPVAQEMRWSLWRSVVCPKVTWQYAIDCAPEVRHPKEYKHLLKQCLQGSCQRTRHAWFLRLALQTGYQGDLRTACVMTRLRCLFRWIAQLLRLSGASVLTALESAVTRKVVDVAASLFGCVEISYSFHAGKLSWIWDFQGVRWQVWNQTDKFLHVLPERWRLAQMQTWLQEERRDSQFAQQVRLQLDVDAVSQLRSLYKHVSPNARAVMLGGFTTEATMPAEQARNLVCPYCNGRPPFLSHILWECPLFHDCRWPHRPPDDLAARPGWTWPFDLPFDRMCVRLNAMGLIRDQDAKHRMAVGGCHRRQLQRV